MSGEHLNQIPGSGGPGLGGLIDGFVSPATDTTPPVVTFLPLVPTWPKRTLSVRVTDDQMVATVRVTANGGVLASVVADAPAYTVTVTLPNSKRVAVLAEAWDHAGNMTTAPLTITR